MFGVSISKVRFSGVFYMKCVNCNKLTNNPKFCCRSCSVTFTNKTHPKRKKETLPNAKCSFCNKSYLSRSKNLKIKLCSKECSKKYKIFLIEKSGSFTGWWNNNKSIRKYLIEKHGNYCSICHQSGDSWNGKPITLIVDHIDGKADNWSINNIRLVCPNCDSQLPTFKGRNIGKSTRKFTITQK